MGEFVDDVSYYTVFIFQYICNLVTIIHFYLVETPSNVHMELYIGMATTLFVCWQYCNNHWCYCLCVVEKENPVLQ